MIRKLFILWRLLNKLEIEYNNHSLSLSLNGLSLLLNKEDVHIKLKGDYIQDCRYSFTNCDSDFILKVKEGFYEECLVQQD